MSGVIFARVGMSRLAITTGFDSTTATAAVWFTELK
jgi:hypothetical protein